MAANNETPLVKMLRDTAAFETKSADNPFEERTKTLHWKAADEIERLQAVEGAAKRIKDRIDARLNNYLCEMKEGYDDSITGFNEAWDVVRKMFAEDAEKQKVAELAK